MLCCHVSCIITVYGIESGPQKDVGNFLGPYISIQDQDPPSTLQLGMYGWPGIGRHTWRV